MKNAYSVRALTRRLLAIARRQKRLIALGTVSSIVGNLSRMSLMTSGAALILTVAGYMAPYQIAGWGICFVLSAVLIPLMRYTEGVTTHAASYSLLADMQTEMYHRLRQLGPAFLIEREKGDLISVAVTDIDIIEKFFAHTIGPMFTVVLLPAITLIFAYAIHPFFALTLFPIFLLTSIILPLAAMHIGKNIGAVYRRQLGNLKSRILETVFGLRDIRIFGREGARLKEILRLTKDISKTAHALTIHRQLVNALPQFFVYFSRILIVLVSLRLGISAGSSVNQVILLSFVVSASFSSTQSLVKVVTSLLETFAAAGRYFAVLDASSDLLEAADPAPYPTNAEISFEKVSFAYPGSERMVLRNLNLSIKPGEKIGIMGESGAGKSTILRLLVRFWDPLSGRISIGVTSLADLRLEDIRSHISMVEQDVFLYHDTIGANIAFGKKDATEDEIRDAARRAGIADMIEALPGGYETSLGELGNRLSGGERQRIGIARALLRDSDVIIMDEPTSSLDVFHEKMLLKTLEDECQGKTLIIVSHRMSTLAICDRVYRFADGELAHFPVNPSNM